MPLRELTCCFPSAIGEQPDHHVVDQPGLLGWLTGDPQEQAKYDRTLAYRKKKWTLDDGIIGPCFQLSAGTIIRVELFRSAINNSRSATRSSMTCLAPGTRPR